MYFHFLIFEGRRISFLPPSYVLRILWRRMRKCGWLLRNGSSKQQRRKIRALFSPYTKTDDKGVRWCGHELTALEILPRRCGQLLPRAGLGLMGVSGAPAVERNTWSPLGNPVACVCLCLSENPSPECFPFYACAVWAMTRDENKSEHSTTKAWLQRDAAHTLLVLHAMLVLILQAGKVPTSERHK